MTETFEKKGMTLITDSFVCRTLQFQERLEKLLYDIHTEFPEKVYSLELLFEKFSGFLKTDMDDGGRFDALIKAAAGLTRQAAPRPALASAGDHVADGRAAAIGVPAAFQLMGSNGTAPQKVFRKHILSPWSNVYQFFWDSFSSQPTTCTRTMVMIMVASTPIIMPVKEEGLASLMALTVVNRPGRPAYT